MRNVWGIVGALALWALAGCQQGLGDRCQLRTDCGKNEHCQLTSPGAINACAIGGICAGNTPTTTPCKTSSQCQAGLICLESSVCEDNKARICQVPLDGGVPDLAPDLSGVSNGPDAGPDLGP